MRHVHLTVAGIVQGVGYRYSLQTEARRHHVTGWVRNRRDGTVESELHGADADVAAILAWAGKGPRGASVSGVTVSELATTSDVEGFEIRADA
ncbi:acylphosphatase [Microbacterium sp. TNHR37B]|uniref:acylphosphatase n=1 Tax=Microbacterium sp. TNHR37B TaxID=1775956 RepID=UPI0007B26EFF|nr:acylphosphatase [Microbacterium sp. TNHR37B]KZE91908.1 Acylphosphatase [Microbacterium sp. TNHR37B]